MQVSVDFLFSHNSELIGSRFISWGTKHLSKHNKTSPSHVAILVNNRWVHEATINNGVRVISIETWQKYFNEVARVNYSKSMDYSVIKNELKLIKNKRYDWLGVIYLGLCVAANKILKIPIPKKNILESKNKFFCCEVIEKITNNYYGMHTPTQILSKYYE